MSALDNLLPLTADVFYGRPLSKFSFNSLYSSLFQKRRHTLAETSKGDNTLIYLLFK